MAPLRSLCFSKGAMEITIPYPVINLKMTGKNIRNLRQEHSISVLELQRFLGLASPQAVYNWERGISLPTVDNLCALSHAFGVTINDILVVE